MTDVERPNEDRDLAAAEQRVDAALDRLQERETITAADLERFRQALPTHPEAAELTQRALPFPFSDIFEYVSGSAHQSPYWRLAPSRDEPRSAAERRARERFAAGAQAGDGRGTVELADGTVVPVAAARAKAAQEATPRAADAAPEELTASERDRGRKALRRLRDVVGL